VISDLKSLHLATIDWKCGKWSGMRGKYSREHLYHFVGGVKLKATDAIALAGYSDPQRLEPLKLFVATVFSAHMLGWLHAAFSHGVEVESHMDAAEGVLTEEQQGVSLVSELILKQHMVFRRAVPVTAATVAHYHRLAWEHYFVAGSIKTKVTSQGA
jgi:organic hydroperoxide reductase OsmC/OhrA